MKILIVASWYTTEKAPFRGSFFREQAIALKKAGHDVTIVTVDQLPTKPSSLKQSGKIYESYDDGIRVLRCYQLSMGCGSHGIGIGKLRIKYDTYYSHNLKAYRRLFTKLKRDGEVFDIVHAHAFCPGGYAACKLKDILGAPVVVTEHCSFISAGRFTPKALPALRYTVENADRFCCVSEHLALKIREHLKLDDSVELPVIPNILSPYFHEDTAAVKHDRFTFVSVGSLIPRKGMELLIDAFAEAFAEDSEPVLKIIGQTADTAYYDLLRSKIDMYGMNDRISLLSPLEREALSDELRRCHCFVLASRVETFGVVYIEAMACGLPTIGTLNGGSDEVLRRGGAIAIAVDDKEALISAMRDIRGGIYPTDVHRAASSALSLYGEEAVCRSLEQTYQDVIANH